LVPPLRLVFILLAVTSALIAVAIPLAFIVLRRRTGFALTGAATSTVIASDVGHGSSLVLRDATLGIRGKPDYLLEANAGSRRVLVPLEVKPTRRSAKLYESDRVQIGAYLIALRASFADRASRVGYVRYANQTFEVVLTSGLEREIRRLAVALKRGRGAPTLHRSHSFRGRCRACPVRKHCDEAID
jgi:hypothetical protein